MITAGLTLWRQFKSLCEPYCRQSIIITAVISFLSPPAFALMIYGGYSLLGSASTSDQADEGTTAMTVSWAVSINRETRGDRIILSAAETVRQRFVFETPPPEDVPLPRPKPEELIALQAPPVDLLPALGRDKREECAWDRHQALPDFMRSCLAPPLQLTPPKR